MRKTSIFSQLLAVMLAAVIALATPVSVIASAEVKDDYNYVAIGDSVSNGYGFDDYYTEDGTNLRGYRREATSEAYPRLIAEALGEQYNVNYTQLSGSAMRPADVYYILRNDAVRDDYADRVFTAAGKAGYGNDSDGQGEQWIAKWAGYEGDLNSITAEESTECENEVHDTYVEAITNADLITISIGYNNLGTFLTGRIPVEGLNYGDTDTLQDMFDDLGADVDVSAIRAEIEEIVKTYLGVELSDYLSSITLSESGESIDVETYIDLLLHAYISFAVYYTLMMEEIYKLNPDAEVVVLGLTNLQEGLKVSYDGEEYDLGEIFGVMLAIENLYMAACDPHCGDYYYADVSQLDVTTFMDELASGEISTSLRNRLIEGIFDLGAGEALNLGLRQICGALASASEDLENLGVDESIEALIAAVLQGQTLDDDAVKASFAAVLDAEDYDEARQATVKTNLAQFVAYASSESPKYTTLLGQIAYIFGSTEIGVGTGVYGLNVTADELVVALLSGIFNTLSACAEPQTIAVESTLAELQANGIDGIIATIATELMSGEIADEHKALVNAFLRFMLAEGVCCHPNAEGHEALAAAVLAALESKQTAAEYSATVALELIEEYGPVVLNAAYTAAIELVTDVDSALAISADVLSAADALEEVLRLTAASLEETKAALAELQAVLGEELVADLEAAYDRVIACGEELVAVLKSADGTADDVKRAAEALTSALDDINTIVYAANDQIEAAKADADAIMTAELDVLYAALKAAYRITADAVNGLLDKAEYIVAYAVNTYLPESEAAIEAAEAVFDAVEEFRACAAKTANAVKAAVRDIALPAIDEAIAKINEAEAIAEGLVAAGYTEALYELYAAVGSIYGLADEYEYAVDTVKAQIAVLKEQVGIATETVTDLSAAFQAAGTTVSALTADAYQVYQVLASEENSIETKVATIGALITVSVAEGDELAAAFDEVLGVASEQLSILEELVLAMYVSASFGVYEIDPDSYYVSLGDSVVTGMGLDGYENYGYGATVPESFPAILSQVLGVDYTQLAIGGLRTTDMLYILDADYAGDEYAQTATVDNVADHTGGTVAELRETYTSEIEKADLITIALGGNDFGTFIGAQTERYEAGEALYAMDFSQFVNGEYVEAAYEAIETLSALTLQIVAECGVEIDDETLNTLGRTSVMVESYLYSYLMYSTNCVKVLDKIHEINPDALVIVVGMYNTVDDLYYDDGNVYLPLGAMAGNLVDLVNLELLGYAMLNENTLYVDISDVTMFADEDEDRASTNLFDGEYLEYMGGTGLVSHPSAEGHAYIAEQILNSLFWYRSYLPGDVDEDGDVDGDDVIYLMYNLVFDGDGFPVNQPTDYNNDGVANEEDVIYLMYYTIWPEDFPLFPENEQPE